jgi:hypothetical protein
MKRRAAVWLAPRPVYTYPSIDNPFWIEGVLKGVVELFGRIGLLFLLVSWVISAISLMLRREEADQVERQQLKWFAASLLPIILAISLAPWYVGPAALVLLPIATGIAIFRYRLYDIDRIVNRTLVYGVLTAILVGLYLAGVIVAQTIFHTLTGQVEPPQLAIVASTLAIAALFNPLRRRIQAIVDRRFYRSKYDAAKTLEAFSSKLRDETDLDRLRDEMVSVIRGTMQPAHVGLRLRPETEVAGKGTGEERSG